MFMLTTNRSGAIAVLLGALCLPPVEARGQAKGLGDLTGPWQLLVDDHVVASRTGVVRTYHAFEKYAGNPVLPADKPWEGGIAYVYGTILPNESGGGYRMWYHSYDGQYHILYATSNDGISWAKPELGLVSFNGSTANNILIRRTAEDHTPQVMHTPWETDPQRRYKLVNFDYGRTPPNNTVSGYYGAYSADGIHWLDVAKNPILPDRGDVGQFVWDPRGERYLGYPKKFTNVRGFLRRCVGWSATTNFESWPTSTMVIIPDAIDDRWITPGTNEHTDFYGLSAFAYESMYIGFLWIFRTPHMPTGGQDGPIFVELVTSHDGVNWARQEGDRPPVLPLGPAGSWDDGMIFTPNHPLVEGGTIKMWYGGFDATHEGANAHAGIGLATLRKDGFASLDAGASVGDVITKKLQGMSGTLRVNYAAAAGGSLKVEVLDALGQPLPGYDLQNCVVLTGDSVDQAVSWGSRNTLPNGADPLRLRFVMQKASLYSFATGGTPAVVDDRSGVLCTFEGDGTSQPTDKLSEDGRQVVTFAGAAEIDRDPAHAAFGSAAAVFPNSGASTNLLKLGGTSTPGTRFTLAAKVKPQAQRLSRLFSSMQGASTPVGTDLVFDFDPQGSAIPGLRCTVNGTAVQSSPVTFADGNYHHLAMTSDNGAVKLYLDGVEVGSGSVPPGPVLLERDLTFGADLPRGGSSNHSLPLMQGFESDPVGSAAGWEVGYYPGLNGAGATTQLGVIDTDASPRDGGSRCVRWRHEPGSGRGGLARRWGTLPSGTGILRISYDFKVVVHNTRGLVFVVSGWDAGNTTHLNVYAMRFDSTTEDGLAVGFNYYQNNAWTNIVPVSDVNEVIGHWFHKEVTIDVAARTVNLTLQRLDGTLGVQNYAGSFQTPPGVNPLDADLANYDGVQVFQSSGSSALSELLVDNLSVQLDSPSAAGAQFAGWADDVLVLQRVLDAAGIEALSTHGAGWLFNGPLRGDFNRDGAVDGADFLQLLSCWSGPGGGPPRAGCDETDLDQNGVVDQSDFGLFQRCFTDPLALPDPACSN